MARRMSVTLKEYRFFRSFSTKIENWSMRKAEALWRKMRERKIAGGKINIICFMYFILCSKFLAKNDFVLIFYQVFIFSLSFQCRCSCSYLIFQSVSHCIQVILGILLNWFYSSKLVYWYSVTFYLSNH